MGRPKHPITAAILEAVALLEKNNMEVTPASVRVNVKKKVTWDAWSPEEAFGEALDARITRTLRSAGYVVSDAERLVRVSFWEATPAELEEQLDVKRTSSGFDRMRIQADEAVVSFLKEKEKELGYPVYPGLFHADVDRIYTMHGLTAPGAKAAA